MIYLMSDIHGCFNKYSEMLNKISFCENDTIFILGDVLDRGNGGVALIFDIMERKNVTLLRGNHDHSALYYLYGYVMKREKEKEAGFESWLDDGGRATSESFLSLTDPEKHRFLKYLSKTGFQKTISIKDKSYSLSHTLPDKILFDKYKRKGEDIPPKYYMVGEPDYDLIYSKEIITVTGHTPTHLIDEKSKGHIWRGNGHIALDCFASSGGNLGCIALETGEEYYI